MKRIFYAVLLVMAAAAVVSAQQWGPGYGREGPGPRFRDDRRDSGPGRGYYREDPREADRETVTLTGKLELIDGNIALRQDTVTYYIAGLNRLTGFVDGLKEGAEVTLEGVSRKLPGDGERRVLLASRLGLNGKTYDNLTPALTSRPLDNPNPPRPEQRRRRNNPRNVERY
ncbi:MAG: hypothetical protein LBP81_09500 [Treponema sp.]|jgi:hypothetical protein|nr:hypothetical protein [Treponema sp.]